MAKLAPDVGALCGLDDLLPPHNGFVFSRYEWAARPAAWLLYEDAVPLWLHELWPDEGITGDTINWGPLRDMPVEILAHPGKSEVEFSVRVARNAIKAGVLVSFCPPLKKEMYQLLKHTLEFRREWFSFIYPWFQLKELPVESFESFLGLEYL